MNRVNHADRYHSESTRYDYRCLSTFIPSEWFWVPRTIVFFANIIQGSYNLHIQLTTCKKSYYKTCEHILGYIISKTIVPSTVSLQIIWVKCRNAPILSKPCRYSIRKVWQISLLLCTVGAKPIHWVSNTKWLQTKRMMI